jgi:hypothetical protein
MAILNTSASEKPEMEESSTIEKLLNESDMNKVIN